MINWRIGVKQQSLAHSLILILGHGKHKKNQEK
jgi:hypothetical protein